MKITRYFVTCREENQRIYILEVGWDGNLPHIYYFFEKVSYRNHLNIHPCPTSIYFKILNKMLNKSKKNLYHGVNSFGNFKQPKCDAVIISASANHSSYYKPTFSTSSFTNSNNHCSSFSGIVVIACDEVHITKNITR